METGGIRGHGDTRRHGDTETRTLEKEETQPVATSRAAAHWAVVCLTCLANQEEMIRQSPVSTLLGPGSSVHLVRAGLHTLTSCEDSSPQQINKLVRALPLLALSPVRGRGRRGHRKRKSTSGDLPCTGSGVHCDNILRHYS